MSQDAVGAAHHVVEQPAVGVGPLRGARRGAGARRDAGDRVVGGDQRRGQAGSPDQLRVAVVDDRQPGVGIGVGGEVGVGAPRAARGGLVGRLWLLKRAPRAAVRPCSLAEAPRVRRGAGGRERGAAGRGHPRQCGGVDILARVDVPGIACRGHGGDVAEGVRVRKVRRGARPTGRDLVRAEAGGGGHRGLEIGDPVGVGLHEQDLAVGADRRHRVEVERDLLSPARAPRERRRISRLIDLLEAAVRSRRTPAVRTGRPVGGEVAGGSGIVERIDDRHRVAAPRGLRQVGQVVGLLEVGRGVRRGWSGGRSGGRRGAVRRRRRDPAQRAVRRDMRANRSPGRAQNERLRGAGGVPGRRLGADGMGGDLGRRQPGDLAQRAGLASAGRRGARPSGSCGARSRRGGRAPVASQP